MRVAKYVLLTGSLFTMALLSQPLLAEEEFSVKLDNIEKIKSQEKSGDELFISVTEFPKHGTPSHYQIPNFPTHWLSGYLKNLKDVPLWHKSMKTCDDVKVVFSLVEEDLPPWDLNDLLGSVELTLSCQNGKPVASWSIPNSAITQKMENEKSAFSFIGQKANYRAKFSFETKEVDQKK